MALASAYIIAIRAEGKALLVIVGDDSRQSVGIKGNTMMLRCREQVRHRNPALGVEG